MSEVGKVPTLAEIQALWNTQNFWLDILKRSSVNNQKAQEISSAITRLFSSYSLTDTELSELEQFFSNKDTVKLIKRNIHSVPKSIQAIGWVQAFITLITVELTTRIIQNVLQSSPAAIAQRQAAELEANRQAEAAQKVADEQAAAQRKQAEADTSKAVNAFLGKFGYKVDRLFWDYDAKRPPVIERSEKWEKLLPQKTRVENGSLFIETTLGTQYEIRPNGNIMKLKAWDTSWTIQHRSLKLAA